MCEFRVVVPTASIFYRLTGWSIIVPFQLLEFYLILSAVKPDIEKGMFMRFFLGTVEMLAFGLLGEAKFVNPLGAFVLGLCIYGFFLGEVFSGEAGQVNASGISNKYVQESFNAM